MMNKIVLILSNIILALSQWAIAAIIARQDGIDSLGLFSLITAVVSPLVLITSAGLIRQTLVDSRQRLSDQQYIGARNTLAAALLIVGVPIALFLPHTVLVIGITLIKLLEQNLEITVATRLRADRAGQAAKIYLVRAVAAAVPFWLGYLFWQTLPAAVLMQALALALTVLFNGGARLAPWKTVKPLLRQGWSLGVALTVQLAILNGPKYALSLNSDMQALGLYSALSYFVVAGAIPINSITALLIPHLSSYSESGERHHFRRLLLIPVGLIIAAALIVASMVPTGLFGPILQALYGPEAQFSMVALLLIVVVGSVDYINNLLTGALTAIRAFHHQLAINFASALTGFTVVWLLNGSIDSLILALCGWLAALLVQTATISITFIIKRR